jgi:hypothetical protein
MGGGKDSILLDSERDVEGDVGRFVSISSSLLPMSDDKARLKRDLLTEADFAEAKIRQ